jgi:4-hydroxy-tetrahydrodipicolinate synthase
MSNPVFRGVGTAMVTPFTADGKVDYYTLQQLVEFQIKCGANAIIACGTTGEKSTLRHEEHLKVIETILTTANKRIPVIAGTGSNDTLYTLELSKEAEKMGADGLLMVTPYYNKTSQSGLIKHYNYVADRVNTPIILYNVPSRTGVNIQPETYASLCNHPNIVATKEANGDISALARTICLCGDKLDIYSGNDDQTVAMMAMGAKGVISVVSNLIPQEMATLCKRALDGDFKGAMSVQNKYLDLMNQMFIDVNPIPVKEAMNMAGLTVGECRMPLFSTSDENKEKIREALHHVGLVY